MVGAGTPAAVAPRRFHGTIRLDPRRALRDADNVVTEIVQHLASLADADIDITLEIDARVPSGVPDNIVRTVTENSRVLKFESAGFEQD